MSRKHWHGHGERVSLKKTVLGEDAGALWAGGPGGDDVLEAVRAGLGEGAGGADRGGSGVAG